eukprot:SAG31_NODE_3126_length_4646_cov_6.852210_1_plen_383_part_00
MPGRRDAVGPALPGGVVEQQYAVEQNEEPTSGQVEPLLLASSETPASTAPGNSPAVKAGGSPTAMHGAKKTRRRESVGARLMDKMFGVEEDNPNDDSLQFGGQAVSNKPKAASRAHRDVQASVCGCCATDPMTNKRFWFLHPEGSFRKTWDLVQSALLIYIAIAVPIRIGFDVENATGTLTWWMELLVDMYFWIDIVLNFRTGFYNRDGMVVYDFKKIGTQYMLGRQLLSHTFEQPSMHISLTAVYPLVGWFCVDVISCFPASYIAEAVDEGGGEGLGSAKGVKVMRAVILRLVIFSPHVSHSKCCRCDGQMLRLLRLAKMLRLGRLKRILQRYSEELQPYVKIVKLAGMLLIAGFLAHLLAATWFSVGQVSHSRNLLHNRS